MTARDTDQTEEAGIPTVCERDHARPCHEQISLLQNWCRVCLMRRICELDSELAGVRAVVRTAASYAPLWWSEVVHDALREADRA